MLFKPLTLSEASSKADMVSQPLDFDTPIERRGRLRLRTLILLRWLAVAGQTAAMLVVVFGLKFSAELGWCLAVIAASAWLNVFLMFAEPGRRLAKDWEAAAQLGFDVVQLALLLSLTGGLKNPFCLLLIAPATVAAATLPTRQTLVVALMAFASVSMMAFWSLDLPWIAGESLQMPKLYELGVWVATIVGIAFTAGYAWQAALESTRMELALAATQAVLAREQRLSALGGLAAAAAHELGTPLATIQVVAKELWRAAPAQTPLAEDAELLVSQAERCREILKRLSQRPDTGDVVHARFRLPLMLAEVTEPYEHIGPQITVHLDALSQDLMIWRQPEVLHALSGFVENAVDFAKTAVKVSARTDAQGLTIEIRDDGPGFSAEVIVKLGEPYVTSRPDGENSRSDHHGMGLGFFIAKTLLERSGAKVAFGNDRRGGAVVAARWPRSRIEAPPSSDDVPATAKRMA